jgi:hypothetical protein
MRTFILVLKLCKTGENHRDVMIPNLRYIQSEYTVIG